MGKKFVYSHTQYEELVGCKIGIAKKIALCGLGKAVSGDLNWGNNIQVILIPHFVAEISKTLRSKNPLKEIVPEGYPRLRAMQFALSYGN